MRGERLIQRIRAASIGFKNGWLRIIRFEVKAVSSRKHILIRLPADRDRSDQSSASMSHMGRHYVQVYTSVTDFSALLLLCLHRFACSKPGIAEGWWSCGRKLYTAGRFWSEP
jgi:hypothetical protein